jgi:hypothetical protein
MVLHGSQGDRLQYSDRPYDLTALFLSGVLLNRVTKQFYSTKSYILLLFISTQLNLLQNLTERANIDPNKQNIKLYNRSTIMKLGHMILILSLGVIAAGVVLMATSGINASHPFLSQNMLVTNDIIKSKELKNSIVNVTETGPDMYVVIKSDPSNIPLSAIVKDPNGSIVSSSTFSQDLVANFKPEKIGKYNLILINQGTMDLKINAILGYLPLLGENESPNYNALGDIFIGAALIVLGCFGFAGGIFISIKNQPPRKLIKNAYTFSSGRTKNIIAFLKPGHWRLRRSSTKIHRDLIAERLGEYEKFGDEEIIESEFEKKQKLTEGESNFNR